jgi:hypothetical protein
MKRRKDVQHHRNLSCRIHPISSNKYGSGFRGQRRSVFFRNAELLNFAKATTFPILQSTKMIDQLHPKMQQGLF